MYDENLTDACGETALHHAIKHSHKEVVELLISKTKVKTNDESGIGLNAIDYSKMVLLYEKKMNEKERKKKNLLTN